MILAYIDPGTGSMLFSIIIGIAITVVFFARAAWIRLKTLIYGRKNAAHARALDRERIVIYSEGKRYWNVFLPIVEELERRGIDAAFYTSEEDDPAFVSGLSHIHTRYIGKGNAAYARLNMLDAEFCLMTTPGLDVYQLKRSKRVKHYSHILHAVDDTTSYRLFGLDYFDSILLSGEYQRDSIRELEEKRRLPRKELPVVGSTYLDVYAAKIRKAGARVAEGNTVLVSPSWGESGLLRRYGDSLLKPLAESEFHVIIRPHPQSVASENGVLNALHASMATYPNVEWDFAPENLGSLARSKIMISDFSGIIFDYSFLFGRPVIFSKKDFDVRPYDASDVAGPPWKFRAIERIGRELMPGDFPRISEHINSIRLDDSIAAAIDVVRNEAWQYRGESGQRAVDFILERAGA